MDSTNNVTPNTVQFLSIWCNVVLCFNDRWKLFLGCLCLQNKGVQITFIKLLKVIYFKLKLLIVFLVYSILGMVFEVQSWNTPMDEDCHTLTSCCTLFNYPEGCSGSLLVVWDIFVNTNSEIMNHHFKLHYRESTLQIFYNDFVNTCHIHLIEHLSSNPIIIES